jgi:2-keto-4-pentenoate hydratase/2-oxohepta-3-ene-1,7-dioic acid hydratase in catechol pathway
MAWARVRGADGTETKGFIKDDMFHPRSALGSDDPAGDAIALSEAVLLPPVIPGKFLGLWNNFHAAAEKNGWTPPEHPLYFLKSVTSLAGPGATVTIPADVGRVLFEGELGVVIGTQCHQASVDEAAAAIFGYTCVNDFTALNILTQDPSFPQWTRAKGYDGFGVIGPVIATGLDWRDLTVKVTVNGRERQSYACSDMIFGPEEIVARISKDMTLMPGDVIACGTSLGAMPVKAGQEVEVVIDGIGSVAVTMAAAGR